MFIQSIKSGLQKGIKTTWMLTKVVVPVYFFIKFLEYTDVLTLIAKWCEPLMKVFHLPGEVAVVLVLGNSLNIYAGVGAIKALSLSNYQITVLSLMLVFSHSLFMETAVVNRLKMSGLKIMALRLTMMVVVGIVYGEILGRVMGL